MFKSDDIKTGIFAAYATAVGTNGLVRLYDGARPATMATAITTQNLLYEGAITGALWASTTAATATMDPVPDAVGTAICTAVGKTATWGCLCTSAGVRKVDFTVAATGAEMNLTPDALIKTGQTFTMSSLVLNSTN